MIIIQMGRTHFWTVYSLKFFLVVHYLNDMKSDENSYVRNEKGGSNPAFFPTSGLKEMEFLVELFCEVTKIVRQRPPRINESRCPTLLMTQRNTLFEASCSL